MYKIYPKISTDQNCPNVYTYERRKIGVSSSDNNCIITFRYTSRKRLAHSYRIALGNWSPLWSLSIGTPLPVPSKPSYQVHPGMYLVTSLTGYPLSTR